MTLNELKAKRKKLIRQYNQIDRQAKRLSHEFTKALNEPDITGTEFRRIETASKNAFNVKAKIDGELLKIENQISKMKSKLNANGKSKNRQSNPAYIITYDNGSKSIVDMASRVTLDDAKKYFLGKTFSYENANGVESYRKAVKVENYDERKTSKIKNSTVIKAKKIGHIDVSKTHNPAKLSAADIAKIEQARGLVEALGYKRPVDIRAAWQDTLFAAGMRGRKLLAAVQVATKKKSNPKRRRNLDHKDADHPIDVSQHWRSGPPGYMSPWQRAAALGQNELFSTGIQLSKRAQELRGRRSNPGVTKAAYRSGLKEAPASQLVKLVRIGLRTGNTAAAITADLKKTGRFSASQISNTISQGREAEQKAKQNPARGSRRMGGSRELAKSEKSFRQVSRRAVKARESGNDAEYSALLKPLHQRHKTFSDASTRYIERKKQTRKANGAASAVKQIFEKFGGRTSTKTKTVSMPNGTPAHVAKLGTLRLIKLKNGPRYEFKGAAAPFLAADHRGKLHVVGGRYRANPPGQTLGEIETIEYETTKPHLGQDDETIYFHHLGEETGERPVMRIDADGLIKIIGGAYTIEADGIHN